MVCVGDFAGQEGAVAELIAEVFGDMQYRPPPSPPVDTPWDRHPSPRVLILPDEENTSSSVTVDCKVGTARRSGRSVVVALFVRASTS